MSLFKPKKKESDFSGGDMDIQQQLKRIIDQIGFLEKKIDTLLESGNRPMGRPFGGGRDGGFNRNRPGGGQGNFRGGQNRGGQSFGNTRFAGDGPRRYSSDSNRGFGGDRSQGGRDGGGSFGGGHRGPRRDNHRPRHNNADNVGNHKPFTPAPAPAASDVQPE